VSANGKATKAAGIIDGQYGDVAEIDGGGVGLSLVVSTPGRYALSNEFSPLEEAGVASGLRYDPILRTVGRTRDQL
jgi:hypothetical protein